MGIEVANLSTASQQVMVGPNSGRAYSPSRPHRPQESRAVFGSEAKNLVKTTSSNVLTKNGLNSPSLNYHGGRFYSKIEHGVGVSTFELSCYQLLVRHRGLD